MPDSEPVCSVAVPFTWPFCTISTVADGVPVVFALAVNVTELMVVSPVYSMCWPPSIGVAAGDGSDGVGAGAGVGVGAGAGAGAGAGSGVEVVGRLCHAYESAAIAIMTIEAIRNDASAIASILVCIGVAVIGGDKWRNEICAVEI